MDVGYFAENWGRTREETITLIDEAIKCKSFSSCFTYDQPLETQSCAGGKFLSGLKLACKYIIFPSSQLLNVKINFRLYQYVTWKQIDFHGSKSGFLGKIRERIYWLLAAHMNCSLFKSAGFVISPFVVIEKGFWTGEMSNIGMSALSRVGERVHFGGNVDLVPYPSKKRTIAAEIKDGATVWTGAVIVGVTVGENATVGANSVVTKDVPAGATVAGNPTKIIFIKPVFPAQ